MATRSTIAIQNADGTVTGIYCHSDGYLSNNGRILQENYTTEDAVRELIALGDLSSLGENIGEQVDFNRPADGQCVAYGRDRGEKNVDAVTCNDWIDFLNGYGQGYDYLYVPSTGWRVRYYEGWSSVEMTLDQALVRSEQE